MAIYTIHGGHAAHGNKNCGAVGYCSESLVDRQIAKAVRKWLQYTGHTVYDCSVDSGLSASNIIAKIKKNINAHPGAKANISIHLNAAARAKADHKIKGCEALVYSTVSDAAAIGQGVCQELKALGFTNRGVKKRTDLAILKGITNGGQNVLIEVFFCDDEDDYNLYKALGVDVIGKAIAQGITGTKINAKSTNSYISEGIDYSKVFNPTYYELHNKDVAKTANGNSKMLFNHFINFGMKEGRQGAADFNVSTYKERYSDLRAKFGSNLPEYYKHFCCKGFYEGRKGI